MVQLNQLDWEIIAELQKNGREANSSIAKKLDVTEGTVRQRFKKLLEAGVLKVSGQLNPEFLEDHMMVMVGMTVQESRRLEELFHSISDLDEVHSVAMTAGRYDLMAQVIVSNNAGLVTFLTGSLAGVDGIASTETFVLLKTKNFWL